MIKKLKKKQFVAFARVSSREQEREGFSLSVQKDALYTYADKNGGEICKFFSVAETASKQEDRKHFTELIEWTAMHADSVDALLFYKVDRAVRNMSDFFILEGIKKLGIKIIYVTQECSDTPEGRFNEGLYALLATLQTDQQGTEVKKGVARRVMEGLFPQKPPYGYENYRQNGRSLVRVHPENGQKIQRIFELYAYHSERIDSIHRRLYEEGVYFSERQPKFTRSKIGKILRDQSYIGMIWYEKQWKPGSHEPLIDMGTWHRVQALLGHKHYQSHKLLFAGELIHCGHCGHVITGENVEKKLKSGDVRRHTYYRCSKYNIGDHPKVRLKEAEIDRQILDHFKQMRVDDEEIRN